MSTTKHIGFQRGKTYSFTTVSRDDRNQPRNLTDSTIYLAVRADLKVAPTFKLKSGDTLEGWRVGIDILDQDQYPGQYTVTFIPEDTVDLVALGHDDPYLYDVTIADPDFGTITDINTSNLDLYPQITDIP